MKNVFEKFKDIVQSKKIKELEEEKRILSDQLGMSMNTISKIEDIVKHERFEKFNSSELQQKLIGLITINYNYAISGVQSEEETEKTKLIRDTVKKNHY